MVKQTRFTQWFILLFIAIQPLFDAATFWLVFKLGYPNIVVYVRVALVLLLGLLAMVRVRFKPLPVLISAGYLIFIVAQYFLSDTVTVAERLSAVVDASKLFLMPLAMLWLVWLANDDAENAVQSAWSGISLAGVVIAAIVAVSLITGTHYPTYDKPWLYTGLNGWFYSGNGQSIILVSILPFLLALLLARPNWMLLLGVVVFWVLMFFNGTRIAYFGLLVVLAGMLVWMLICQKAAKTAKFPRWTYATLCVALFLAIVLYPVSTPKKIENFRIYQVQFFESLAANATPPPPVEPGPLPEPTPATPDTIAKDTTVWQYYEKWNLWPVKTRLDRRYIQTEFMTLAMKNATPYRWLFGYGSQWYTLYVGDLETDYPALLGGYGLIGTALFLAPVLWLLISALVLELKRKRNGIAMGSGIPLLVTVILLGAALYSGRALQQPSVSIYLSISLAVFYLVARHDLQHKLPKGLPGFLTKARSH